MTLIRGQAPVGTQNVSVDAAGNLNVNVVSGGGGGGGPATIADGADVAQGATTDAKVTGDNSGTLSAKLRGLATMFADVWDSVNHYFKVSIQNATLAVTQSGTWSIANLASALTVTALQVTASGDTQLLASGTRKLYRIEISNSHASTALTVGIKVPSLNSGATFGKKYLPAAGGLSVWTFPGGYLQNTSEAVTVNLSAAGQVEVTAYYV